MRLRLPTALACALALVFPSAAAADHGEPVADETLARYMQVAAAHWGGAQPTCTGPSGESIPAHAVLFDDPDPAVGARAEMPGCRIWLDRNHWPAPASEQHCNLLAHEWGHLLGHDHSSDQSSLMWASWVNEVVPGCMAFRPAPPAPAPRPTAADTAKQRKRQGKRPAHGKPRVKRRCAAGWRRSARVHRRWHRRHVRHRHRNGCVRRVASRARAR